MDVLTATGLTLATSDAVFSHDAGSVTTYSTTATLQYSIRGKLYLKTAVTNGTTPTTDINTGAAFVKLIGGGSVANTPGQGSVYLWLINAAGTVAVAQGQVQALDMQNNFIVAPQFPAIPAGYCPFAYSIVKAGATASASGFAFGTTNWNATGIVVADQNIGEMLDRPQVA